MLGTLSVASLAGGAALSYFADRPFMARRLTIAKENVELCGGALLMLGFVVIGVGLSPMFG